MDEGQRLLDRWEARYPKAFAFRHEQQRLARQTGYLAMISGRQVWVGKKASLPVCANYPVQGGALDVMAGAVSWFKDMMDGGRDGGTIGTSAMILGTVHDEMIAEAHKDDADEVAQTMHRAMELGWLDMFPGTSIERLVDGGTGPSWGDIS
jgi:DNA polymerase-1